MESDISTGTAGGGSEAPRSQKHSVKAYEDLCTKLNEQNERNLRFIDKARWSSAELKILHENFESFVKMHKIKDSKSFLFSNDLYAKRKKKSLGFSEHMNNRLDNRTKSAVLSKIKEELTSLKQGSLSLNEIEELFALQKICGNRWMEIACAMGRNKNRLSQKYYRVTACDEVKDKQKLGRWSAQETKDFNAAIDSFKVSGNRKRREKTKIDWSAVSKTVGTRSIFQCKTKYEQTLAANESKRKFRTGNWDDSEIKRLKYAIGYDDIANRKALGLRGFDWIKISQFVGARSSRQCFTKSCRLLKVKEKKESKHLIQKLSFREQKVHYWDDSCNKKLLKALRDENDENSIDWHGVQDQFDENYPIHFLKNKWYLLKVSKPNYQICSFEQLIDHLCKSFPDTE